MARSTRMFDRGADALQSALPQLPHVQMDRSPHDESIYLCPLCLGGYGRHQVDWLTREHAPPEAVGGSVITLTCTACNNAAGSVQSHAARRLAWQRFAAKQDGVSLTVRVGTSDGATLTAEIEHRNGEFYIELDPDRSHPSAYQAMLHQLDQGTAGGHGPEITIEGDVGFRRDHADASDLRDAYLAAFALLGYRYILWPDLDAVRARVAAREPEPKLVKRADIFPDSFRGVITMSHPIECVSVITAGGRCVFLPWPAKGAELEAWLAAGAPTAGSIGGRVHEWPKDMPMLLDFPRSPAA